MLGQTILEGRKSTRLSEYDYSLPGGYFVTVYTKERVNLFGKIINGKMHYNDSGRIVQSCWVELQSHYPNIELEAFVVMPNHVHGIIIIIDNLVGARHASPLQKKSIVLGNIIGSFKSAVTKNINEILKTPGATVWQRSYYEHIIRNERSFYRISEYILTNPERWQQDKENPMFKGTDALDSWLKEDGKQMVQIKKNI